MKTRVVTGAARIVLKATYCFARLVVQEQSPPDSLGLGEPQLRPERRELFDGLDVAVKLPRRQTHPLSAPHEPDLIHLARLPLALGLRVARAQPRLLDRTGPDQLECLEHLEHVLHLGRRVDRDLPPRLPRRVSRGDIGQEGGQERPRERRGAARAALGSPAHERVVQVQHEQRPPLGRTSTRRFLDNCNVLGCRLGRGSLAARLG